MSPNIFCVVSHELQQKQRKKRPLNVKVALSHVKHPRPVSQIEFDEPNLAGRKKRMLCRHGVSIYNCAYVSYSHTEKDIDEALERCEKAMKEL